LTVGFTGLVFFMVNVVVVATCPLDPVCLQRCHMATSAVDWVVARARA